MSEGGKPAAGVGSGEAALPRADTREAFISYASADAAIASALCLALERQHLSCWIAPRDVTPGALYADEIIAAINGCQALVVVLSANATLSPHVIKEIERATSKAKRIVTLRADATVLPPALEYFLSDSQWIDLSEGTAAAFAHVATALRSRGAAHARTRLSHAASPPEAQSASATAHRWKRVGQAAIVLAALGTFALKIWITRHETALPAQSPPPVPEPPGLARQATQGLPDDIPAPHLAVIGTWLEHHPRYRLAVTADCQCDEQLQRIRQGDGGLFAQPAYQPYRAAADFDGDGAPDLAVVATARQPPYGVLVLISFGVDSAGNREILEISRQEAGVSGRGLTVQAPRSGEQRARLLFGTLGTHGDEVPIR